MNSDITVVSDRQDILQNINPAEITITKTGSKRGTSTQLAMVPYSYPANTINRETMDRIMTSLTELAIVLQAKIKINRYGLKNGGIIITTEDDRTKEWIQTQADDIRVAGKKVKICDTEILVRKIKVTAWCLLAGLRMEMLVKGINLDHPKIGAEKWNFYHIGTPQTNGREFHIEMDAKGFAYIRAKRMTLSVAGVGKIRFEERK